MGKRKKESGLEILLRSHWWVSVIIGLLVYGCMRWLIPTLFASSPYLEGLSLLSQRIAWLALPAFAIIASFSFLHSSKTEANSIALLGHQAFAIKPKSFKPGASANDEWLAYQPPSAAREPDKQAVPEWNLQTLRTLEWKRFELLCAKYYEILGFKSVTLPRGADGGIDIKLYKIDPARPIAVVQCKAWNTRPVGVKEPRELLGVMAHEKVERGIFISSSTYSKEAIAFAADNPLQLLDGDAFLQRILKLDVSQQHALARFAFDGDYATPTCPSCGIKMIRRHSERGSFWGCVHYPRCKSKIHVKDTLHHTG